MSAQENTMRAVANIGMLVFPILAVLHRGLSKYCS